MSQSAIHPGHKYLRLARRPVQCFVSGQAGVHYPPKWIGRICHLNCAILYRHKYIDYKIAYPGRRNLTHNDRILTNSHIFAPEILMLNFPANILLTFFSPLKRGMGKKIHVSKYEEEQFVERLSEEEVL